MRIYNKYIIILALLFMLSTVILAASGENRLGLYFSAYLIECLVVTLFFAHLNPKARRGLNVVCFGLFIGFGFIVLHRVVEIVIGSSVL